MMDSEVEPVVANFDIVKKRQPYSKKFKSKSCYLGILGEFGLKRIKISLVLKWWKRERK